MIQPRFTPPMLLFQSLVPLLTPLVAFAVAKTNPPAETKASYALAQAIPVTCLNRTTDTGEHITDSQGQLQYIPFLTCNETNRPLELYFGVENDINCTIPSITDPLFHLLEFYIHNDAPLTCRIPTHPLPASAPIITSIPSAQDDYIPLIFALAGALQRSHLHVSPRLNVILHTSPDLAAEDADILAASAYSVPSLSSHSARIVIGDPLELKLSVRWYSSSTLPPSTTATGSQGLGGHVHFSTVVYCFLSAGVGVAASLAYFRGVELPRRIRQYGKDRLGGGGERGYAFPGSGVFGMNGYGAPGVGKRD